VAEGIWGVRTAEAAPMKVSVLQLSVLLKGPWGESTVTPAGSGTGRPETVQMGSSLPNM
jgi:hypothetical protein